MEQVEQLNYLKSQIAGSIKSLYERRSGNKRKAFIFQIATTILSAISTIFLGLKIEGLEEVTRIIALIISSTITVISGADAFFNHKKLWLTYADTLNDLYSIRFDLEYKMLDINGIIEADLTDFKNRYQSILNKSNEKWMRLRADAEKEV